MCPQVSAGIYQVVVTERQRQEERGQAERAHHRHPPGAPDPRHPGLRPGPVSLHRHGEQLQADRSQDQLESVKFRNGGGRNGQMVPVDLGRLREGFALPPQGHPGRLQPLGNADDQPVLQGRAPAAGGRPEHQGRLRQAQGPHQQPEKQEQEEPAAGVLRSPYGGLCFPSSVFSDPTLNEDSCSSPRAMPRVMTHPYSERSLPRSQHAFLVGH